MREISWKIKGLVVNALNDYMDISSIIAGRKFLGFYEIRIIVYLE